MADANDAATDIGAAVFSVSISRHGGTIVLCVTGEFDLQGEPVFMSHLGALDDSDHESLERLCLDLRGLTFIDSSGLHAIVKARARAADAGVEFAIDEVSAPARRVFTLAGLDDMLPADNQS
jgi:anti-anti-sigma factor